MKRAVWSVLIFLMCMALASCGDPDKHKGQARTPSGPTIMKGKPYETVVETFEDYGFKNVKTEPIEDLITGWLTKDGEVEKVSVGGDFEYSPDVWVDENTEVVVYYHTFPIHEEEPDTEPKDEPEESLPDSGVAVVDQPAEESRPAAEEDGTTPGQDEMPAKPGIVIMDKSVEDFQAEKWNVDDVVRHFEELGFQDIQLERDITQDDEMLDTVSYIEIDSNQCQKGLECDPKSRVVIWYYTPEVLTVYNCPELAAVLSTTDVDLKAFAEEYDDCEVEFDGRIISRVTQYGEDSIDVKAVDQDGNLCDGYRIVIGDRSLFRNIDESALEGDDVYVKGRISESWCEFYRYNSLYVETEILSKR